MYAEHQFGKIEEDKEKLAAYLDAIKCWPVSPSVQPIIDATQMYLDNKEKYRIQFQMPAVGACDLFGGSDLDGLVSQLDAAGGGLGCCIQ